MLDYLDMVRYTYKSRSYGSSQSQMDGGTQFIEAFGNTVTKQQIRRISEHQAITFSDITALLVENDERNLDILINVAEEKNTHKKKKKRRKQKLHDLVETMAEVPSIVVGALTGMSVEPVSHGHTIFFFLPGGGH